MAQHIACPVCKTDIPFDVRMLLEGKSFICPKCNCSICIDMSSKPVVEDAMHKYDELMKRNSDIPSFSKKFE